MVPWPEKEAERNGNEGTIGVESINQISVERREFSQFEVQLCLLYGSRSVVGVSAEYCARFVLAGDSSSHCARRRCNICDEESDTSAINAQNTMQRIGRTDGRAGAEAGAVGGAQPAGWQKKFDYSGGTMSANVKHDEVSSVASATPRSRVTAPTFVGKQTSTAEQKPSNTERAVLLKFAASLKH